MPGHVFGKATALGVIRTSPEQNYSTKTDFETRKENQYFKWQNISTSRPLFDLTTFGKNMTNGTKSPISSIPVGKKMLDPTSLTRPTYLPTLPTESSKRKGKAHIPEDPETDPSLSDSSSNKYNSLNVTNYSKPNQNKCDTKKNRHKHKK